MWREKVRRFFGWKSPQEKAKRKYDLAYLAGVTRVNECRGALGVEGEMQFAIPESKLSQLWQEMQGERNPAFVQGMRDRLTQLGYPDSSRAAFFAALVDPVDVQLENRRLKTSLAVRNKAFYQLAARADILSMEDFIREFKYVFRIAMGDDKDYAATVQQMHYDEAWISGQKHDFNQYNVFANRTKTLDTFFTKIGAGIS